MKRFELHNQQYFRAPVSANMQPKPRPLWTLSVFFFLVAILLSVILIVTLWYSMPTRTAAKPRGYLPQSALSQEVESALQDLCHIDQNDTRLIDFVVQSGLMRPPHPISGSHRRGAGRLLDPSMGQSKVVLRVLNNVTGGFFIEAGALDGETRSNTLYMEKELGWRGLLVEPDPSNFKLLQRKRRNAYSVNVCLATKRYPHAVWFQQNFNAGKIFNPVTKSKSRGSRPRIPARLVRVQCMPVYTLLLALNVTTVDYFSLDVEGAEFDVLRTIPFDKILIRVLSVEYRHDKVPKGKIAAYMEKFGYRVEATVTRYWDLANDFIFVHESVY